MCGIFALMCNADESVIEKEFERKTVDLNIHL